MKEIGVKLRVAREAKKISLEEIQAQTKIRRRFLEAIESGDWDIIPGEIYRRGFICNYAELVGLDGEKLWQEYRDSRQSLELEETGDQADSSGRTLEKPSNIQSTPVMFDRSSQPKIGQPALLIIIIVLILIGFLGISLLFSGWRRERSAVTKPKTAAPSQSAPTSVFKERDTGLIVADAGPVPTATTIVQQLYPAPLSVWAEFSETVWVQVTTDGLVKFPGSGATFTPQSLKQLWTAQQKMVIRVGNPAGIRLTFNGKAVELKGKRNQPRTIILTADGVDIH
ncbi:MAG: DUF4115 domain-containing protein [Bacillota bacterium]|jgi:cytoskeletal protein RodZ